MLAALLLSVVGGLTLMLSPSSPLAAETHPSATRSLDSSSVGPGAIVTVTITLADDYEGNLARITERLPDGFDYVPDSVDGAGLRPALSDVANGTLVFNMFSLGGVGGDSFTYKVTASETDGSYMFEGDLIDAAQVESAIEATPITVSAGTTTGPDPVDADDKQFDVVKTKAVKGAVVSGLKNPIGSNPLQWEVETGGAAVTIAGGGLVGGGDFRVEETSEGSGTFQLLVENSGAPALNIAQAISVDVTYEVNGADVTETLIGDINEQDALAFIPADGAYSFTIPQGIGANTPIGAFVVTGDVYGEYLDGIVSGGPFQVRDSDMTLVYSGSSALEVKTYTLDLTVNGDAGMANRAIIGTAKVKVTASNLASTAPATFAATVKENAKDIGSLVDADTDVGDASEGVSANDGDTLTYSLVGDGASAFAINAATGMITVGSDGISDSDPIIYTFRIMVSDGISANNQYIEATVDIDVNDSTTLVVDADLPAGVTKTAGVYKYELSVPARDVPITLFNLRDLVSDNDGGDKLTFNISDSPSHIVYDQETDELRVTYLPPSADTEPIVSLIKVEVSDGFNTADTYDQTLSIEITVKEDPPAAITSKFISVTVAENSTDCSQSGEVSGCSLAGEVPGATSFSIESGVDGGKENYAVDSSTGEITVKIPPNFEDDKNPAFLVNANNAEGLAGLISVRVAVTDVNEVPVFDAASVSEAPVNEDAQDGADVATFTAIDQDAGDTIAYSIADAAKQPFSINSDGELKVKGNDAFDINKTASYDLTIVASDGALSATHAVTVNISNSNDAPSFDAPVLEITIPENTAVGTEIADYDASDPDGDALTFTIKIQTDTGHFGLGAIDGKLTIATGLDYEDSAGLPGRD